MGDTYPMLVVDAGNSCAKFAVVARAGSSPKLLARVPNAELDARTAGALWKKSRAATAFASCVVPATARILRAACPGIRFIGARTRLNFRTSVDRKTVGADRLANMAEAARRFGSSAIVCDFGTAATFDLLDGRGRFAGGAIAPGLRTVARALHERTARLPEVSPAAPTRFAGRNTRQALRSGLGGYAGLVRYLVAGLASEHAPASREQAGRMRRKAALVFTGGDAARVERMAKSGATIDPLWTLRGIAVLGEAARR